MCLFFVIPLLLFWDYSPRKLNKETRYDDWEPNIHGEYYTVSDDGVLNFCSEDGVSSEDEVSSEDADVSGDAMSWDSGEPDNSDVDVSIGLLSARSSKSKLVTCF